MALRVCQLCAVDFTLKHFLLPLIDGMSASGWDVTSVCSDGKYVNNLRQQGYKVNTIPISRSLNPLLVIRSYFLLLHHFRTHKYDVVHVHTPVAALIGRLAAKTAGVPFVVYTAHGFYFHDNMSMVKRYLYITIERFAGLFTDLLFCQSQEDSESAASLSILPSDRIYAIGNGVDPLRFSPLSLSEANRIRSQLGIADDSFVVGLVARQVAEKGIHEFLQAALLLNQRYQNICFMLIGERLDSDHNQSVTEAFAAAQSLLGSRLHLLGSRSDIPSLLSAMDVFCLPSWREGMPRSIIEAMMMAKPVIATDIRGSREEVVHNHTGLLVPVRSPCALSDAIETLMQTPSLRLSMGQNGRLRALTYFDENNIVSRQIALITRYVLDLHVTT